VIENALHFKKVMDQ